MLNATGYTEDSSPVDLSEEDRLVSQVDPDHVRTMLAAAYVTCERCFYADGRDRILGIIILTPDWLLIIVLVSSIVLFLLVLAFVCLYRIKEVWRLDHLKQSQALFAWVAVGQTPALVEHFADHPYLVRRMYESAVGKVDEETMMKRLDRRMLSKMWRSGCCRRPMVLGPDHQARLITLRAVVSSTVSPDPPADAVEMVVRSPPRTFPSVRWYFLLTRFFAVTAFLFRNPCTARGFTLLLLQFPQY